MGASAPLVAMALRVMDPISRWVNTPSESALANPAPTDWLAPAMRLMRPILRQEACEKVCPSRTRLLSSAERRMAIRAKRGAGNLEKIKETARVSIDAS